MKATQLYKGGLFEIVSPRANFSNCALTWRILPIEISPTQHVVPDGNRARHGHYVLREYALKVVGFCFHYLKTKFTRKRKQEVIIETVYILEAVFGYSGRNERYGCGQVRNENMRIGVRGQATRRGAFR